MLMQMEQGCRLCAVVARDNMQTLDMYDAFCSSKPFGGDVIFAQGTANLNIFSHLEQKFQNNQILVW